MLPRTHIERVLVYVKTPDDVFLIDLHFLDDDTHFRVGTDHAAMVDPVPLAEGSVISEDHGGWKSRMSEFNPTQAAPERKRQQILKQYERELLISRLRDYDREDTDTLRALLIRAVEARASGSGH